MRNDRPRGGGVISPQMGVERQTSLAGKEAHGKSGAPRLSIIRVSPHVPITASQIPLLNSQHPPLNSKAGSASPLATQPVTGGLSGFGLSDLSPSTTADKQQISLSFRRHVKASGSDARVEKPNP